MGRKSKLIIIFASTFFITFVLGIVLLFGYASVLQNKSDSSKESLMANTEMSATSETNASEEEPANQKKQSDVQDTMAGNSVKMNEETALPGAGAGTLAQSANSKVDEEKQDSDSSIKPEAELELKVETNEDDETKKKEKHAVLAFAGDVCFHDAFSNMGTLVSRGGKIQNVISQDLLDEMLGADVFMVNNEFPYSRRGTPIPEKMFTFRSKPENVKYLEQMGVDIVGIANNHAFDHGEEAFLDTMDTLDEAGIARVGGGHDLDEASKPYFFEVDGIKIGYLAATQIERNGNPDTKGATENSAGVLRCFSEKELNHFLDVTEKAKQECDFLVVFIHWGTESTDVLDWAQPYQADLISKAGADIIVGAHPHVLQGIDVVNNVPVIYSLGNYWFNSKTVDTMLLKVCINQDGLEQISLIPALQSNCTTTRLCDDQKERVLTYLQSLSPNIHIDSNGIMTW